MNFEQFSLFEAANAEKNVAPQPTAPEPVAPATAPAPGMVDLTTLNPDQRKAA